MTAQRYSGPPAMVIDPKKQYFADIETNKGTIRIQLLPEEAPVTVNNFVFLAREGYYDGVIFHRVVPGFVIQGGDPTGQGHGGPGYRFNDESVKRAYLLGTVAMANAGPNTNGSQFFICLADQPSLPKNYTIFGETVDGIDVVKDIVQGDVMNKVTVEEQ
jgi:peptidyl-prolyl cis-trans isomerase B (cyclophilin B)